MSAAVILRDAYVSGLLSADGYLCGDSADLLAFARLIAEDCARVAYEEYASKRGSMIHGTGIYFEMAARAIRAKYLTE